MRYHFPQQLRLKKSTKIQAVFRKGKKFVGKYHNLFLLPANEMRIAIITPKRLGNAVTRNSAKRKVREICRQNPESLIKAHQVFFVKRLAPSFHGAWEDILQLLEKAKESKSFRRSNGRI